MARDAPAGRGVSQALIGSALALAVLAGASAASGSKTGPGRFQAACERLVGARAVALVAVEPATGRLRARVHPGLAAEPHPPGSVFKLVTALAAIEAGIAAPGATFACAGAYRPPRHVGKPLPCWKPGGHGRLGLEEAIANSCNVTFYQLAERVGAEPLGAMAARAGVATAPGWWHAPRDETVLALRGVGEGEGVAVTAEQLAGLVGAIATDGVVRRPAWTPGRATGKPIAPEATLQRLRTGMRAAVVDGSARNAAVDGLAVAGKTGTATYTDGTNRTYGWFVGFAPAERPRLAIVVFEKNATGFLGAASLGRRVFEAWRAAGSP